MLATGKGEEVLAKATQIADALDARGVTVLLDDRKASPGVKFADAEILGMPISVVVGRGLADGKIEVRTRRDGGSTEVAVDDAIDAIIAALDTVD